jgi:radical SAM-linked protein
MHRLRIRFGRREEVKFISHLDIIRLWHRALRRADIELVFSEGFNPHPKILIAAPLALGITSEAELMDIYTNDFVSPNSFLTYVGRQLPPGIDIIQVYQIANNLPSLQMQMRYAEYITKVKIVAKGESDIKKTIFTLLSKKELTWQHKRDTGFKNYDLRELIDDIWLVNCTDSCSNIAMRLRCDSKGSGRPEQVIKALGFKQLVSIHRTKLILEAS